MKKEKNFMKINAEVVNGECPTCNQITVLVGVSSQFYRCMECGADLEQHVNGKISYYLLCLHVKMGVPLMLKDGNK
tara:strand:+ start:37 stop:264 length:228 start_codon:yes stop_codon:yes gene_type:complete